MSTVITSTPLTGRTAVVTGGIRKKIDVLREHGIEVPVLPIDGKLWVRISAQVYNELPDYEALARFRA